MKFYRIFMLAILAVSLVSCSDSNEDEKSSVKQITEFAVGDSKAVIDQSTKTVTLSLPQGSDITKVKPIIKLSDKATVVPASGEEVDLTNPVKYTVTAENGSKQEFTVTATVAKSSDKKILEFAIGDSKAEINESAKTITLSLPSGTDVTKLKPTLNISPNSTVVPASGEEVNFTNSVKYTVTAQDGTKQEYSVTVTTKASTAKQILSFAVGTSTAQIDETAKTITLELPSGTDITKLKPVVTVSSKATVVPGSGEETNFTNPVKYTVTAEDASKQEYTVTITVAATEKVYLLTKITEMIDGVEKVSNIMEYDDQYRLVSSKDISYNGNIEITNVVYNEDGTVQRIVNIDNTNNQEYTVTHVVTYVNTTKIQLENYEKGLKIGSDIVFLNNKGLVVEHIQDNDNDKYEYDINGNVVKVIDSDIGYAEYTYDNKKSIFRDSNTPQWVNLYTNNILSVSQNNILTEKAFDKNGIGDENFTQYVYTYNDLDYPLTNKVGTSEYKFYYTIKDKK